MSFSYLKRSGGKIIGIKNRCRGITKKNIHKKRGLKKGEKYIPNLAIEEKKISGGFREIEIKIPPEVKKIADEIRLTTSLDKLQKMFSDLDYGEYTAYLKEKIKDQIDAIVNNE